MFETLNVRQHVSYVFTSLFINLHLGLCLTMIEPGTIMNNYFSRNCLPITGLFFVFFLIFVREEQENNEKQERFSEKP